MSQDIYLLFDAISFIASLSSLILAIIAIWLTLSFKRDADKVNKQTSELLTEIKVESKYISREVMSELKAYGDSMRGAFGKNIITGIPTSFEADTDSDTDDADKSIV